MTAVAGAPEMRVTARLAAERVAATAAVAVTAVVLRRIHKAVMAPQQRLRVPLLLLLLLLPEGGQLSHSATTLRFSNMAHRRGFRSTRRRSSKTRSRAPSPAS